MSTIINFEDTAIAFASKSNDELKNAYNLFRLMNNTTLVSWGSWVTEWAFKIGMPISAPVRWTVFEQFCGGRTIEECLGPIEKLAEFGVETILDYGVEAKQDEEDLESTARFLANNLKLAAEEPNINIVSAKITGLIRFQLLKKVSGGEDLSQNEKAEWERGQKRVRFVSKAAFDTDIQLYYDAEESWIQGAVDDLVQEMAQDYNKEKPIIVNTVQLYRKDRLEFLKTSHQHALDNGYTLAVKIVRGAYMEKERERAGQNRYESPIQENKGDTDRDYDAALKYCVDNIETISFCNATHNQQSCEYLIQLLEEKGLDTNHPNICNAQLFGMSDHLSFNMAKAGFRVFKYLPYGPVKEVVPYLIRRAKENSSVNGQMGRELSLLHTEMTRRGIL